MVSESKTRAPSAVTMSNTLRGFFVITFLYMKKLPKELHRIQRSYRFKRETLARLEKMARDSDIDNTQVLEYLINSKFSNLQG